MAGTTITTQTEAYARIWELRAEEYTPERHREIDRLQREWFNGGPVPTVGPQEGHVWVRHALTGYWVEEEEGTPWHCSVQSEAYFSN